MKFNELNLDERILKGISEADFDLCTPMQAEAIRLAAEGADIVIRSAEGSGRRTALFLGALSRLLSEKSEVQRYMMVVLPSRYR